MSRIFLLALLLCVLGPLQGFAQSSPPPGAPSAPNEDPSDPKGGPTDDGDEKKPKGEIIPRGDTSPRGTGGTNGRATGEALAGILLGAAGAAPGLMMMAAPCLTDECDSSSNSQFLKGMAWSSAGWTLGVGLGIVLGGSIAGGEGGFIPALGGATVGTLVAVAGSLTMLGLSRALLAANDLLGLLAVYIAVPLVSIPLLIVAPLVGGISFYEKSHERAVAQQQVASAGVRMLPVVSVSPSGGLVAGLLGQF